MYQVSWNFSRAKINKDHITAESSRFKGLDGTGCYCTLQENPPLLHSVTLPPEDVHPNSWFEISLPCRTLCHLTNRRPTQKYANYTGNLNAHFNLSQPSGSPYVLLLYLKNSTPRNRATTYPGFAASRAAAAAEARSRRRLPESGSHGRSEHRQHEGLSRPGWTDGGGCFVDATGASIASASRFSFSGPVLPCRAAC